MPEERPEGLKPFKDYNPNNVFVTEKDIKKITGCTPKDMRWYWEAFTHSSATVAGDTKGKVNTQDPDAAEYVLPTVSYETLEFYGDSELGRVVARLLFTQYRNDIIAGKFDQGDLTTLRSKLVRDKQLAKFAEMIGFKKWMTISKTLENMTEVPDDDGTFIQGRNNVALAEDCMEAFIGALSMDLGLEVAERFVLSMITEYATQKAGFGTLKEFLDKLHRTESNFKGVLNEYYHKRRGKLMPGWQKEPVYVDEDYDDSDGRAMFTVSLTVPAELEGYHVDPETMAIEKAGTVIRPAFRVVLKGRKKKEVQVSTARIALVVLDAIDPVEDDDQETADAIRLKIAQALKAGKRNAFDDADAAGTVAAAKTKIKQLEKKLLAIQNELAQKRAFIEQFEASANDSEPEAEDAMEVDEQSESENEDDSEPEDEYESGSEDESEVFTYIRSGLKLDNRKKCKSVTFNISRYGAHTKTIKFKHKKKFAGAIEAAEEFLSQKIDKEYFKTVSDDLFGAKWKEFKGGLRGDCLGDCKFLEAVERDAETKDLSLVCGS
jgi:dsRNA-specific ribonuclease